MPSRAKAVVLSVISRHLAIAGNADEAICFGREALGMAEQLGLDAVRSEALVSIGLARVDGGDPTGVDDMERGLAIAVEMNSPYEICLAQHNIWGARYSLGQLKQSAAGGITVAESALRFGLLRMHERIRGLQSWDAFDLGDWDEALLLADDFLVHVEFGSPEYYANAAYCVRAQIRSARDDDVGARVDATRALELASHRKGCAGTPADTCDLCVPSV